ncbi:Hypothetical protein CINCED_3A022948 [Cinara cedri]|uniref:Uncharacterized protein n=1 Tax=Cinara cedri TaxID=506608 RepID=A0A5E4M536_9HEMI|nr:Hypothetical protein CINCED_3A022948 [Cinara cedri]
MKNITSSSYCYVKNVNTNQRLIGELGAATKQQTCAFMTVAPNYVASIALLESINVLQLQICLVVALSPSVHISEGGLNL